MQQIMLKIEKIIISDNTSVLQIGLSSSGFSGILQYLAGKQQQKQLKKNADYKINI